MRTTVVVFGLFFLVSCVDTLQDAAHPPGQMDAGGRIYPCHGWESDKQLCGDSKFFAKVINAVAVGQTKEEVRAIMKRDPWRREASVQDGAAVERWGYPTSYEDERMAWITFRDGKVSELKESAWESTP
jgi:hypothetical protein